MSTARRTYVFVIAALLSCGLLFSQTAHMANKVSHAANLTPCTQQLVKLTVALPNQKAMASAIAVVLEVFAFAAAFLMGVQGFGLRGVTTIAAASPQRFAGLHRLAFAASPQRGLVTLRI